MKRVKEIDNNCLISIIIPAYNVELYIDQCIKSILQQTYQNIEVIIIDDGSTDQTPQMCDNYSAQDSRVKVYHQENAGQAAARNFALTMAKGEYIIYIDCDDYVSLDYIENLFNYMVKYEADIVQCYAQKFWDDGKKELLKISETTPQVYNASEALKEFCYQRKFYAAPWAKLIRRELMEGLAFPENMGYEDMAIMYKLIGKVNKIVLLPKILYFYRQHNASTMHNTFSKKKIDRIIIAEDLKRYIEMNFPENSTAVKTRYILANFQLLMDLPYNSKYKELRKKIKINIRSVRWDVIMDKQSKRDIRLMSAFSFLGVQFMMFLGRMYKKIFI